MQYFVFTLKFQPTKIDRNRKQQIIFLGHMVHSNNMYQLFLSTDLVPEKTLSS